MSWKQYSDPVEPGIQSLECRKCHLHFDRRHFLRTSGRMVERCGYCITASMKAPGQGKRTKRFR